ncbi:MAG: RagB/SusD family protein [Ferruginibacter sp.]|nr:RagB/SusD family protein [Ferruginibacter sp.]
MKKLSIKKLMLALAIFVCLGSCKKSFDLTPGTELDATLMYRNVYDADAAVMGIYGKFMGLADKYVILNELRADLLNYTANADEYLRQVSTHTVTADNPYTSPRPFYELIINCNDVLKNFIIMKQKNALKEAEFNQRYSDIACLRSFLYLQLGIHFGDEVRYVTDALENVSDINNPALFPKIKFDALLDTLINFTEAIPFKDQYPTGTTLNIVLDAAPTNNFFINKKCLLGDLYLWKGNYTKSATYYRQVMEYASFDNSLENRYTQWKVGWGGNFNHYISYTRGGDASTLNMADGWRTIFNRPYDVGYTREWVWALPYDSKFKPENPLIKLFSPIGGDYLVKPSQEIIDNWNNQQQNPITIAGSTTGIPYDARGLISVRNIGGQPVVMKYLYDYINYATNVPVNPFAKNGKWYLYRQTLLHLRFAEAANRDGFYKLAYGLFNQGLTITFSTLPTINDKTNQQNTFSYPDPYKFDARNGEIPFFRSDWYRNIGIRSRAGITPYTITSPTDSLLQVENGLINEGALENAFEGSRWPDLLRIALRRNDPAFLADKVYNKLKKDGDPLADATRAKLMDKKNWYLPFKL